MTDCCCHEIRDKLNSFHLGYFPVYLSYNSCKFVFFLYCLLFIIIKTTTLVCASSHVYVSIRVTFTSLLAYKVHKARWLYQLCNTNRCGWYTLQSLFFYYLPITNNKSRNITLLSLKLSEIAQLNF